MIESLKQVVMEHGDKLKILSIEHLGELKNEIDRFAESEELNHFQQFIVNSLYKFKTPADFAAKSVIILAVPVPAYAKVEFSWQDKKYSLISLARSDIGGEDAASATKKYLKKTLSPKGYHMKAAPNLPLKRMAARSGLAVYGRNNICYVEGMGSFITLVAYYTDISCIQDDWTEIRKADACTNCRTCINNCPTNAIREDRFLIDNERCLSYFNEFPGEFPEWMPLSAHNCLYDCLKCQSICPMNKTYMNHVIGPIKFCEEETNTLMSGEEFKKFNPDLKKKVKLLGLDQWLKAIPRNLSVLFKLNGYTS